MRYVAVQEPPHHSWAVVDTINDAPAEYGGRVLIGLTLREASWFAAVANDDAPRRSRPAARLVLVWPSASGASPAREKHSRTGR
ncbi:hypothetical protein FJ987_14540 [Mesorhizobium sp. CU2]|uniref:hypothetical protein n=1 Tax=unclassified Mesorhizobium TaxID=325217 RepID=UPI00112701CA|nr:MULTISPECIES: hypothetical protein [unclassified Mesorhizobium]TPN76040.1 hypothetical protein FJ988_29000 [Mesorhizobium sp. CU3]TPO14365.1 hypothetical protein FJ987_14540 [Mesorhizobium sp. CU2]